MSKPLFISYILLMAFFGILRGLIDFYVRQKTDNTEDQSNILI